MKYQIVINKNNSELWSGWSGSIKEITSKIIDELSEELGHTIRTDWFDVIETNEELIDFTDANGICIADFTLFKEEKQMKAKKETIKSLASQYRLLGEFIRRSEIVPFTVGLGPCKSMLIVHLLERDFLNLFSIKECQSFEDKQGVTLAVSFRDLYMTTFIPFGSPSIEGATYVKV